MKLSERMYKHGDTEDFTSIKAVYKWATEVAQLEAENARLKKELLAHKENEGDECPLCACEAKNDRLKRENERLLKGIMAHLHLLASRCECGEPLKETDAFNCLDTLLKEQEDD